MHLLKTRLTDKTDKLLQTVKCVQWNQWPVSSCTAVDHVAWAARCSMKQNGVHSSCMGITQYQHCLAQNALMSRQPVQLIKKANPCELLCSVLSAAC